MMKKLILLVLCVVLNVFVLVSCSKNDEPFVKKDYTVDGAQVTELRIDVRDRRIEVTLSEDQQIHMEYFENAKEYYDISLSNQVLTMSAKSSKEWNDYVGGKAASEARAIILQVPDTLLTTLQLSTTNEDILLSPITVTNTVTLSSNGGNIVFDQLNAGSTIAISAKNGDISGTVMGSYENYAISCKIKKGESNLPESKQEGEKMLEVSNNNGDIDIQWVSE